MIASTTVSATHLIASTTASTSDILVTLKLENKDIFSALTALLTALIGAFTGAWLAFLLQDNANKRKEIKEHIAAYNKMMFVLMRQWNELIEIKKMVDPVISHPMVSLMLPAKLPLDYKELKYDFNSLSFLLETKHRNYITNLYIAENWFQTTIQILNERSILHRETILPRWEQSGISEISSVKESENILGIQDTTILIGLTNNLIQNLKEAIPYLEKTRNEIRLVFEELYPKERYKMITFEDITTQIHKDKPK